MSYTHVTLNIVPFSMSDITLMLASTEKALTTIAIGEGWNKL